MTNTAESLPEPYLGCPIWTHSKWKGTGLKDYARFCSSIEGNTTFYQTPSIERAQQWADCVPDSFRFSFKLPQSITHEKSLIGCSDLVHAFWQDMAPLHGHIGILMAQLPASFGPDQLPALKRFLQDYTLPCALAVEVRHPLFFAKGEEEKQLNRLLIDNGVNRVILDSRALFSMPAETEIEREVQSKKPRLPVNVIASHMTPVVRFIGSNHDEENVKALTPWIKKCHQWRVEGRQPYLFFHCPDNADAPYLLDRFVGLYNQAFPSHPLHCQLEALFPNASQSSLVF